MYDIVVLHGPNDDDILPYCIYFIKQNILYKRKIFVISYSPYSSLFDLDIFKDIQIIDERIFPFTKKDVNNTIKTPQRDAWYYQQLLKLYSCFVIDILLDDFVIIDSDTLFLKPTSFKEDNKYLFNISIED